MLERKVADVRSLKTLLAGLLSVLAGCSALCAVLAPAAFAADTVYWSNEVGSTISFANLDGSGGGGTLNTASASPDSPEGMAVDLATGKLYWANAVANTISFANLNGSGGGILPTKGATPDFPGGVAIEPATGKLYWANQSGNTISFANLDGSGGGTLLTTGATLKGPLGVALDPAAGRIYWVNFANNTISFANLDGSGGGNLTIKGVTPQGPFGLAVDPETQKIYWSNFSGNTISFANLDGSSGGTLNTAGVSPSGPSGLALDPATGRIYWANGNAEKIAFANLDDSGGGGTLATAGATLHGPRFPVLLNTPGGAGVPVISGAPAVGSLLSCTQGAWAPDLLSGFDYFEPLSFAYAWSENGALIPGASASSITASSPGSYACEVTATNEAGPTTQTSAAVTVIAPTPPAGPSTAAPTLTGLSETVRRWREGGAPAAITAGKKGGKKPPVGTTFSFKLNEAAGVTFTFTKPAHGRRVGRKCVAQTNSTRHNRPCARTVLAGAVTLPGHAASNKVRFQGLVSKHKKLKPGSYSALVVATASGKRSSTGSLHFTIVNG